MNGKRSVANISSVECSLLCEKPSITMEEQIYARWLMGNTPKSIAEDFGIKREKVYKIINQANKPKPKRPPFVGVYPNIEKWMKENGMGITKLAQECMLSYEGLRRILKGYDGCTRKVIDRLIGVTGLTYEVLFYREDKDEIR